MDSKVKHTLQRNDSWGELNLPTAHKPGLTDLRTSSKISPARQSHHPLRDPALMLKTLSAEFFEPSSLPALRAKVAAAKQQAREQRYIGDTTDTLSAPIIPLPSAIATTHPPPASGSSSSRSFGLRRNPRQLRPPQSTLDESARTRSPALAPGPDGLPEDDCDFAVLSLLMTAFVRMNNVLHRYCIKQEERAIEAVKAAIKDRQPEPEKGEDSGNSSISSARDVNAHVDQGLSASLPVHSVSAVLHFSSVVDDGPDQGIDDVTLAITTSRADVSGCDSCLILKADRSMSSKCSTVSWTLSSMFAQNEEMLGDLIPLSIFEDEPWDFFQSVAMELQAHVDGKRKLLDTMQMLDGETCLSDAPAAEEGFMHQNMDILSALTRLNALQVLTTVVTETAQATCCDEARATCANALSPEPEGLCEAAVWYLVEYALRTRVCDPLASAYEQLRLRVASTSHLPLLACMLGCGYVDESALHVERRRCAHRQPIVQCYLPTIASKDPQRCHLKRGVFAHPTRTTYSHYHTRWRDAIDAIAKCTSLLVCFNRTTEAMWRRRRRRRQQQRLDGERRPRKQNDVHITDSWLSGGTYGSRASVLVFRSSALAQSSEADISAKPGFKLHITFRVVQAETKLLAKLLECHGINEAAPDSQDYNILWTGSHPKPGILRGMAAHQRVNHFPRSYELTRKDRLYKNIEKMQHAKGLKHFDFIPQTFLMPTEYRELCTTHHRVKGPWIVKPAASSRGRGIYIVESPNQVPIEEPVVVAKYISKPLLIKGHKCDLRLYVAVTSFDPLLIYIYEEGMVRFATVKYDTTHKQLWNPCMHLCNYSINKYHSDYVKSDDPSAENVGHKWTLSALLRHLKSSGKDTAALMTQVEDLVIKAILSCGNSIVTACKMFVPNGVNCFELYGFDILIDENLKPWLLEVNLSPSLGCDSPLDVRLKSAMLADLLTLVGIPAVDPMIKPPSPANTSSSKSLKMKLSNCRRIHSADGLSNHTLPKKASKGSVSVSNSSLTAEDNKMIKNAKGQFLRRGGFVRIFPAVDSWPKYAQYLDTITGIPIAGSTTNIPFSFMGQHNNNQILYKTLYPDMMLTSTLQLSRTADKGARGADRKRDGSLDSVRRSEGPVSTPRQDRYERKLSQGHRSTLGAPKKPLQEDYSAELKRQVCDMVKNGKKLSQVEARKAFSQYLLCVLKRISTSTDQDGHIDIVLKFLQKASTYLKNPFYVKIPSHKFGDKDRAAIVAKQLNDFLYLYNRETDLYADLDRPSQIPKNVFNEFLEHSRESDLEELLLLQNIHTVPNSSVDSDAGAVTSFQGLLRCLPSINSTCFSSPEAVKKPVKVTPLS